MNGLQKMVQEIERKSEQEKESIITDAEKKAAEKIKKTERKAEQEKNRLLEKGKEEARIEKRRILARARQKSRKKELETREKIIEEVMEKAKDEISDLMADPDEYREILLNLIEESGISLDGGELNVSISEDEEKVLKKGDLEDLSQRISKQVDTDTSLDKSVDLPKSKNGVVVEKKKGNVSIDNTFEARLKRMKQSLRPKIAEILFEDE